MKSQISAFLAFGCCVLIGLFGAVLLAHAVETNLVNNTSEACQPSLRIVGRASYESPAGLAMNGQVYLFYDLNKAAVRGDNTEVAGNTPTANNRDEIYFKPKGFVTIKAAIPKAGKYYPALRWRQHGNAGPVIAIEIDEKEVSRIAGGGGHLHWNTAKDKNPIELPAGAVTIVLREACGNPGQNVNMAMADIFTLSTEKRGKRDNEVAVCPTDTKNTNWLSRLNLPLVDPLLKIGECQIQLKGTLQDGAPAWIFPDGSVASAAGLKATVSGTMPKVPAGGTQTVAVTDATESSHAVELSAVFADIKALAVNHAVPTPNDDGVADSVRFAAADKQAEIRNAITGATVKPSAESWQDGSFEWPRAGELPPFSYYEIAVPGFDAVPRQMAVVEVRKEKPLAEAAPRAFSPNDDGVYDTSSLICLFTQGPVNAGVRVVDAAGQLVRQLAVPTRLVNRTEHAWDGKDDKGQTVTNGWYRFEVFKEGGVLVRSTSVRVNSFRKWARAPIQTEPDFFPLGVFYTAIAHPQKLVGLAYHEALFKDLRAHNMNTAFLGMSNLSPAICDLAEKNGIRVTTCLVGLSHARLPLDEQQAAEVLQKIVDTVQKKPAFLVYYVSDEPSRNNRDMNNRVLLCQRILEGLDPVHPPISCLIGVANIAHYTKVLQSPVMFIDNYPLLPKADPGDFRRMYYTKWDLTEYTDLARGNLKDGRPLWIVLQAHNFKTPWTDWLRTPTPVEMRLQIGCSLAYGAKGVFFFLYQPLGGMIGLLDDEFKPTPNYEESAVCCGRIQKLAPLLLKLHPLEPFINFSGNPANPHFAIVSGAFRGADKGLYVIVANTYVEGDSAITAVLDQAKVKNSSFLRLRAAALVDQESGEKIVFAKKEGGAVAKFNMRPGDFRIFKIKRVKEVTPLRYWYQMTPEEQVPTRNKPKPKPKK